jgi:hypothetical protein
MNVILIIILLVIIVVLMWALFGGRADLEGVPDEGLQEQERTLRRRATDKEIEKVYPAPAQYPHRRKDDRHEDTAEEADYPFQLPYLADEIIPETSRYRIYRRTLLNSEIYASKGDYSTAISLYEGVRSRIQDVDTKDKLLADIEYLKHFKKKKDEEARKKEEDAKKGIAGGVSINKGELKITFGGPVPNALNFDSLPQNINIGMIDPNKNVDMEAIVDNVSQKLRGEITGVKEEIDRLKGQYGDGDSMNERQLMRELAGLNDRIDKLQTADWGEASYGGTSNVSDLKEEITELGKAIKDFTSGAIPETNKKPALTGAKLSGVPKHEAPGSVSLREPGSGGAETQTQRAKQDESDDEFELLSEFGKDKHEDELSDEEIFDRILRVDRPKEKDSFEIIGEKKDARDEYVTTNEELDLKNREDDSFYRRLLNTNRRKKKELPILKVSYDFTKLPDEVGLSREKNIIEFAFYKYKPMLEKANEFIKKRKVRDAINYYKVVMSQNIPPEFKSMIRKNLNDLTEYLEKYLAGD